jgi:type II secretory pathway pseudopilin PulG
MEKKNTGKYFKYAVGEIVLVVIGILIALAISNWNSKRNQKNRNHQFLVKLSKELDQNIDRSILMDSIRGGFKNRYISADSVLKILNKGITIEDLDFITSEPRYFTAPFNLNTNIFEELKNTGSLYAIGSDSLVSSFYNLEMGKSVSNRQEKYYEGFFNFSHLYQQNPGKAIANHPWIFDPQSQHYLYYQQYIFWLKIHSNLMVRKLKNIIKTSEELKQLISEEIKKM